MELFNETNELRIDEFDEFDSAFPKQDKDLSRKRDFRRY
jgi:hypothetical protein